MPNSLLSMTAFGAYLTEIQKHLARGDATEHTLRPAVITLPMYPDMTELELSHVADAVAAGLRELPLAAVGGRSR